MLAGCAACSWALIALACTGTATACTGGDDRPRIVATTNILGDVTREIVGDEADVTVLMKPDADPHSFGLSARQAAELEHADLVVFNGLGLEENVLRHVEAADDAGVATLEVGKAVDPLTYRAPDDGGPDEAAGQPDPHFWTDPDRVRMAAALIADEVVEHVDGVDERHGPQQRRPLRPRQLGRSPPGWRSPSTASPRTGGPWSPTTTSSATSPTASASG